MVNRAFEAVASFFVPGLGQMLQGRTGRGVGLLVGAVLGYMLLVLPGLIIHLYSIIDAYRLEE